MCVHDTLYLILNCSTKTEFTYFINLFPAKLLIERTNDSLVSVCFNMDIVPVCVVVFLSGKLVLECVCCIDCGLCVIGGILVLKNVGDIPYHDHYVKLETMEFLCLLSRSSNMN